MYTKKRTAIIYDRVNKWGGAERVLLALHELFPDAPLYTSVFDAKTATWAKVFPEIKTTFLQRIPFAKGNHEFLAPLMHIAFETFDFSEFDLVISVTSEAAKSIRTGPNTLHICYCLTPTRYLWSGYETYFKTKTFLSFAGRFFIKYLRRADKVSAHRPDSMIAISSEVSRRIKKYYGRNSEIIFPPVDVSKPKNIIQRKDFYLIVGRLVGYKKTDLAIRAFNKLGYKLIIVGVGREIDKLKKISSGNITFAGQVSENELINYYKSAKALIMPQEEDFGIVSVEAQSFGLPVISFKKGGAIDTVIDGKTGILFGEQSPDDLINAIKKFENVKFESKDMLVNAQKFSKKIFKIRILELVNKYSRIQKI